MRDLVIGLTDCSKFDIYNSWILEHDLPIKTEKLSWKDDSFSKINECDGILLTGGEDVHPRFYRKPDWLKYCYTDDINELRDELEWKVLEYTQIHGLPVLGICRGLQITNVFFGGTLIPDIPTWGKFNHSKLQDDSDRIHPVNVDPNSSLFKLLNQEKEFINSNHHQSVEKVGKGLVVSALSDDGVVEALERKNSVNSPYLSLVQWHPERMSNQNSPFVKNIKDAFLQACLTR